MSMCDAPYTRNSSDMLYVVAAPSRSDALRVTLHTAYTTPDADDSFADLLQALDRVPITRQIAR
jgi:hypothetical protein